MIKKIFFGAFILFFLLVFRVALKKPVRGEPEQVIAVQKNDLFDEAVECIKRYEGWHSAKHYPYVGYGHKLQNGERFNTDISKEFADSLLRADLLKKCAVFRSFGRGSTTLGVLTYNVGECRSLGNGTIQKSKLIRKLEAGDRDIHTEYISFRMYRGKVLPSLERKRKEEFELLFDKAK
ncbi:MAG: glycoside hydrolase [Prevotella sp.]|jgi:GH24 family phage-related lysozyme (muramidase)|nr:glycoside hydrolase [Prevotella sp.]